jgi:hypothetical protein
MTKTKPKPNRTPEERRERLAKIRELLDQLYKEVEPETIAAYTALFDGYSGRNALLIGGQRPDATDVRGYQEWRKHGRQVRKGEKGIAILAPIAKKDPDDSDDGQLVGVRVAYVFDVAQTDPTEAAS